MFCPYCGTEISDQAKFCPRCGQMIAAAPAADVPLSAAPAPAAGARRLPVLRLSPPRGPASPACRIWLLLCTGFSAFCAWVCRGTPDGYVLTALAVCYLLLFCRPRRWSAAVLLLVTALFCLLLWYERVPGAVMLFAGTAGIACALVSAVYDDPAYVDEARRRAWARRLWRAAVFLCGIALVLLAVFWGYTALLCCLRTDEIVPRFAEGSALWGTQWGLPFGAVRRLLLPGIWVFPVMLALLALCSGLSALGVPVCLCLFGLKATRAAKGTPRAQLLRAARNAWLLTAAAVLFAAYEGILLQAFFAPAGTVTLALAVLLGICAAKAAAAARLPQ